MHSHKISVNCILFQGYFYWKTRQNYWLRTWFLECICKGQIHTERWSFIDSCTWTSLDPSVALTCKSKWTFPLILMKVVRRRPCTQIQRRRAGESCSDEMWRICWSTTADDNELKHRDTQRKIYSSEVWLSSHGFLSMNFISDVFP